MQIDQRTADVRENGRRGRAAVDPCTTATGGRDLAFEYDARLVDVDPAGVEQCGDLRTLGHVEYALDSGAVGAGANEVRAGAVTQQQTDGADNDRLPRAG